VINATEKGSEAAVRLQPNSRMIAAKRTPDEKKIPMMSIMVRNPMATTTQP
jgi:hypothetical protein